MWSAGALHVTLTDSVVESVELNIYDPLRFFEALRRGRAYTEPPDITARVCGICPVAYQVSACNAIEDACGVTLDPELIELRRLLYCGGWIHSHVLHLSAARAGLPGTPGRHQASPRTTGSSSNAGLALTKPGTG